MNRWNKIGSWLSIGGLGMLLFLILSNAAYPSIVFQVLMPLGLGLVFLSLIFFSAGWFLEIQKELKAKNYLLAFFIFFIGIATIAKMFFAK